MRSQRFWPLYILWIGLCALLFFAFRDVEDPSRHQGRIPPTEAGQRALAILKQRDSAYRSYEVVHVAWARAGQAGPRRRWVVLCDTVPHSALRQAVVVELAAEDGSLLTVRKPVR